MKVWITKYALTSGITEHDAKLSSEDNSVRYEKGQYTYGQYAYIEGKEWHRSYENALLRAEVMRIKKIESLKKSIAMLEAMSFKES